MSSPCLSCGTCCDPIYASFNLSEFEATNAPTGWIEKHWRLLRVGTFAQGKFYMYDCDEYDHKTHKCRIQNSKPEPCREFPEYDFLNKDNYDEILNEGCGYRILFKKRKQK